MGPLNRLYFLLLIIVCFMIWIYFTKERDIVYIKQPVVDPSSLSHQAGNPEDQMLILYNRIPKTASTSFMNVVYQLTTVNKFTAAYVNVSSRSHRWLLQDQLFFARNITKWHQRKPAVFHGHFPFVSFITMGFPQPIYINVVREPLERLVSHYYFMRFGDTYLPNKIRKKQGDKTTFDECVDRKLPDCAPEKLWIQIPYFCGSDADCWKHGNKAALHRAKRNFLNYYFLVGTTERIGDFVRILESSFPRIFEGASSIFGTNGGLHIRKTKKKVPLQQKTIDYFSNNPIWKMEREFYDFVRTRFELIIKQYKEGRKVEYIKVMP
ncbi:heparin sulfate O-sulfotransferase-like [Clytia hemisphaerica]|uniref:heparin sulfate O-sulfotransferase-like n=1 Tax=Clytia hemisphaerica TaxID=252671 RepID=UPI0034D714E5